MARGIGTSLWPFALGQPFSHKNHLSGGVPARVSRASAGRGGTLGTASVWSWRRRSGSRGRGNASRQEREASGQEAALARDRRRYRLPSGAAVVPGRALRGTGAKDGGAAHSQSPLSSEWMSRGPATPPVGAAWRSPGRHEARARPQRKLTEVDLAVRGAL